MSRAPKEDDVVEPGRSAWKSSSGRWAFALPRFRGGNKISAKALENGRVLRKRPGSGEKRTRAKGTAPNRTLTECCRLFRSRVDVTSGKPHIRRVTPSLSALLVPARLPRGPKTASQRIDDAEFLRHHDPDFSRSRRFRDLAPAFRAGPENRQRAAALRPDLPPRAAPPRGSRRRWGQRRPAPRSERVRPPRPHDGAAGRPLEGHCRARIAHRPRAG